MPIPPNLQQLILNGNNYSGRFSYLKTFDIELITNKNTINTTNTENFIPIFQNKQVSNTLGNISLWNNPKPTIKYKEIILFDNNTTKQKLRIPFPTSGFTDYDVVLFKPLYGNDNNDSSDNSDNNNFYFEYDVQNLLVNPTYTIKFYEFDYSNLTEPENKLMELGQEISLYGKGIEDNDIKSILTEQVYYPIKLIETNIENLPTIIDYFINRAGNSLRDYLQKYGFIPRLEVLISDKVFITTFFIVIKNYVPIKVDVSLVDLLGEYGDFENFKNLLINYIEGIRNNDISKLGKIATIISQPKKAKENTFRLFYLFSPYSIGGGLLPYKTLKYPPIGRILINYLGEFSKGDIINLLTTKLKLFVEDTYIPVSDNKEILLPDNTISTNETIYSGLIATTNIGEIIGNNKYYFPFLSFENIVKSLPNCSDNNLLKMLDKNICLLDIDKQNKEMTIADKLKEIYEFFENIKDINIEFYRGDGQSIYGNLIKFPNEQMNKEEFLNSLGTNGRNIFLEEYIYNLSANLEGNYYQKLIMKYINDEYGLKLNYNKEFNFYLGMNCPALQNSKSTISILLPPITSENSFNIISFSITHKNPFNPLFTNFAIKLSFNNLYSPNNSSSITTIKFL